MAYRVTNIKRIYVFLIVLMGIVTIVVWRAENVSFADTASKDQLPTVELVTIESKKSNRKDLKRVMHNKQPLMHNNHDQTIHRNLREDPNVKEYGIDTAPYDLSKLHIYGEDEYCDRNKYKNIKYMDVTGMYDTGTNTFYQVLTKNCWGRETRRIDYIVSYPPEDADDEEKQEFRKEAQVLYDKKRPKVLRKVPVFMNVKWKPLTGKHHVISAEQDFIDYEYSEVIDGIRNRLTLVIIKDPLTWFKSLCKASYEVHWWNKNFRATGCPYGLSRHNGKLSANMWHSVKFSSVMELWNWWYGTWTDSGETISAHWKPTFAYWNSTISKYGHYWRRWMKKEFINTDKKYVLHDVNQSRFNQELYYKAAKNIPHLVIRYEDILFQPEKLIHRLCRCVGGFVREGGPVIQESAAKGHGLARGRKQALQTYGNPKYRFKGYTSDDIMWMEKTLNKTLLKLFSYEL